MSRDDREEAPDTAAAVPPWDVRIFALIDPGVDGALIAENLRRTPSERLARMEQMIRFVERARDRRPEAP